MRLWKIRHIQSFQKARARALLLGILSSRLIVRFSLSGLFFVFHELALSQLKFIIRKFLAFQYFSARVVHLVGVNPDDETDRVFACIKNNLALPPPALAFELTEGRFLWRGESSVTEAALLRGDEDEGARSARTEAEEFLCEILSSGPVAVKQVRREAHEVGISDRTLDRAKQALGIKSERQGEAGQQGGGTWVWGLPNVKGAKDATPARLAPLTPSDTKQAQPAPGVGPLDHSDARPEG